MKRSYLDRLVRAARWYLPPAEAAEAIEDYREMLSGDTRSQAELVRDLGEPSRAVYLLARPGSYPRWVALFLAMAACLILPAAALVSPGLWNFFTRYLYRFPVPEILMGLTLGLLLLNRRELCPPAGRRPKGLVPGAVLLLLACLAVTGWFWRLFYLPPEEMDALVARLGSDTVRHLYLLPTVLGVLAVIPGLWGLVLARVEDRRWRGLYLAAVTVVLLCFAILCVLRDMDVDGSRVLGGWQNPYFYRWLALAAVGALGTGVSLC